jgi:hypothetical protein
MGTESMGVEKLVAARWRLDGYWTDERVPLRTAKGAWSDIDVVGWHAVEKTLRLGSCKAYGSSNVVATWPVADGEVSEDVARALLGAQKESWSRMLSFFADPNYVVAEANSWLPPLTEIGRLELHFFGAIWIAAATPDRSAHPAGDHEGARARLNDALTRLAETEVRRVELLRPEVGRGLVAIGSASDYVRVVSECIRVMAESRGSGPRTGVPMLDLIREIVRMTGGSARWAYTGKQASAAMRDAALNDLLGALTHG